MFERFRVAIERLDPGNPFACYSLLRSLAAYEFARPYAEGRKVLDAACGAGHGVRHLAESFSGFLVGFDLSPEALRYARRLVPSEEVSFCCGDILKIPFQKESFDIVTSFQVVEHLFPGDAVKNYFGEIRRILKKEGLFLISTLNRNKTSHGLNPFHVKEYTGEEFEALVRYYFPASEFFGLSVSERYLVLRESEERFGKTFLKIDRWDLRNRLPKGLWEWGYTLGTYCVNTLVTLCQRKAAKRLTLQDFHFIRENFSQGFDFMGVCRKE